MTNHPKIGVNAQSQAVREAAHVAVMDSDELDEWLDRVPPMTAQEQSQILVGYVRAMARDMERGKDERGTAPRATPAQVETKGEP